MPIQKMLSYLKTNQNAVVYNSMKHEYWGFFHLSGLFLDLSQPYQSLIIFLFHSSVLFYHLIMFLLTAIISFPEFFVMCDSIQYSGLCFASIAFLLSYNIRRRDIEVSRLFVINGFVNYGSAWQFDQEKFIAPWKKTLQILKVLFLVLGSLSALLIFLAEPVTDYITGYEAQRKINPRINSKTLLVTYYPYSFDNEVIFYIINLWQLMAGASVLTSLLMALTNYLSISTNITIELSLLKLSIRHLQKRAARLYIETHGKKHKDSNDIRFKKCLIHCFRQNIIHYENISDCFNRAQHYQSFALFTFFITCAILFSTAAVGIISDESSIGIRIKSIILCFTEILALGFVCWVGERIKALTEEIREEIYETEWFTAPRKITSSILIMQMGFLKPLVYSGANLIPTSFETFTTIINSTFSYLNLLMAAKD